MEAIKAQKISEVNYWVVLAATIINFGVVFVGYIISGMIIGKLQK